MKISKNLTAAAVSFLAGAFMTYFLHAVPASAPAIITEINREYAKNYYDNHRSEMEYGEVGGTNFKFNGYFDLSKQALVEIKNAVDTKGYHKVRVYFGQNKYPDPNSQMFLLNGLDNAGREINTTRLILVQNPVNVVTDCPKYCDYQKALLSQ